MDLRSINFLMHDSWRTMEIFSLMTFRSISLFRYSMGLRSFLRWDLWRTIRVIKICEILLTNWGLAIIFKMNFSKYKISNPIVDQFRGSEVHLKIGLMTNCGVRDSSIDLFIGFECVKTSLAFTFVTFYCNGSEVHSKVGHQYGPI